MSAPTVERPYDVVVIGAGPAGENVADRAVRGGLSAVVVEDQLVGGECSYWACMPTKALLRSGAAVRAAERVPGLPGPVDLAPRAGAVLARRDAFASHWHDGGQVDWLAGAGIDLVRGRGRLAGPRVVEVTAADGAVTRLVARHAVVVATGSTADVPPVEGLADVEPWTSREAVAATEVPPRLAVLGGGVVAVEMATAFASLGSRVHVLARDGVLDRAEPFAGEMVTDALREQGVRVDVGAKVVAARRDAQGSTVLTTADGEDVVADRVLVATGRRPATRDLGLETVGLEPGPWLKTDDTLRVLASGTATDWLYAVGDVNGRAPVTHHGKYQARAAGDVIVARARGEVVDDAPWGRHVATAERSAVTQVVFTDPEVASVGLTAATAARTLRTRVVDHDLGSVAGAVLHADGYRGRARLVVDEDRGVVVGATFVGQDVAELAQAAAVVIAGEVPLARLWHAVPAYPTISEVWLRLLEAYGRDESA